MNSNSLHQPLMPETPAALNPRLPEDEGSSEGGSGSLSTHLIPCLLAFENLVDKMDGDSEASDILANPQFRQISNLHAVLDYVRARQPAPNFNTILENLTRMGDKNELTRVESKHLSNIKKAVLRAITVSYTHLTLPTKRIV